MIRSLACFRALVAHLEASVRAWSSRSLPEHESRERRTMSACAQSRAQGGHRSRTVLSSAYRFAEYGGKWPFPRCRSEAMRERDAAREKKKRLLQKSHGMR